MYFQGKRFHPDPINFLILCPQSLLFFIGPQCSQISQSLISCWKASKHGMLFTYTPAHKYCAGGG